MAVTRLGASGFPRPPYGSFAGKTEEIPEIVRPAGRFTRLGVSGFPRPPYASFAGKSPAEPEPEVIEDDTVTGGSVNYRIRRSQQAQLARAIADNLADRTRKPVDQPIADPERGKPVEIEPVLAEVFRLDADALARLRADERAEVERLARDDEEALLVTLLLLN